MSDAVTDVNVVARELGLRDEMVARLQRAVDRLNCAQQILEAIAVKDVPDNTNVANFVERHIGLLARVREIPDAVMTRT
ncbi:hypothetical protein [Caballeronia arvi]|nr:hypothetical protein [Caballeronia arvi]